jgi:hypothetical protein
MTTYFGREFYLLDDDGRRDLESLTLEGCLYTYMFQDDSGDLAYVRVRLNPEELVRYVDGVYAYDRYNQGIATGLDEVSALAAIDSRVIRREVEDYNKWILATGDAAIPYCPVAFLGELEALLCSNVPDRHEVLGMSYTADRRYLLDEVVSALPNVISILSSRQAGRPPYLVEVEQDVRDLLYVLLKPVFPDAVLEDPVPKRGGGAKRVDISLRTICTLIELKMVRDGKHAPKVADELRADIESYHAHPDCKRLVCLVWDPERLIADRVSLRSDLSGRRVKDRSTFIVDVRVLP